MNSRALTLSLVMGIIALFFVGSYVTSVEEAAKKKFGEKVLVIAAKKDIAEMDTLLEPSLDFKEIPSTFLEPGSISLPLTDRDGNGTDRVKSLKGLIGSVAMVPIKKGEQITFNKITEPSLRTGLANQIAPGRRAVAVNVNETTGVSKLIKPGDRVDLITVLDFGGGKENRIAKTILQDVVILSIGKYITNNVARVIEADAYTGREKIKPLVEDYSFATVTLEVDPVQAQTLALVLSNGDNSITLSLRNNEDTERNNFGGSILTEVLGPDAAKIKIGQAGRR